MATPSIPRGIEELLKQAASDAELREFLLVERADAAERVGIELTEAEATMLNDADVSQLEGMLAAIPSATIVEEQEMPYEHGPRMLGGSRPGPFTPTKGSLARALVLALILAGLVAGVVALAVFMSK